MNKWLTGIVVVGGVWSFGASGAIAQTPSYEEIEAMSCQEYRQIGTQFPGNGEGRDFFRQIYTEQGEDAAMLWLSKGGNCVLNAIEIAVPPALPVPTLADVEQMSCDDIKAILTDGSTVARWNFGAEWNLWLERYEACEPGSVIRLGS
jgi:hypothetical protein